MSKEQMKKGLAMVFGTPPAQGPKEPDHADGQQAKPKEEPATVSGKAAEENKKQGVAKENKPAFAASAQEAKKERIQPYSVQIPESLHTRLKFYVDNHARRHESMNKIILDGLVKILDELEKKAGY